MKRFKYLFSIYIISLRNSLYYFLFILCSLYVIRIKTLKYPFFNVIFLLNFL
jgi:hypothetical protein